MGADADGPVAWAVIRRSLATMADPIRLRAEEDEVRARANRVLAHWKLPLLHRLGQLYSDVDECFLTTFPELDHFPVADRRGTAYWGPSIPSFDTSSPPEWPAVEGTRVFAYLKQSAKSDAALTALNEAGLPTLAYVAGLDEASRRRWQSSTLHIASKPVDLVAVGRMCDVAVLNGGHGVTAEMLLAGKPVLQIPLALEQQMTADAVARLGAGMACTAKSAEEVRVAMEALLAGGCAAAARRFASRYESFDPGRQRRTMAARAEELLHAPALA